MWLVATQQVVMVKALLSTQNPLHDVPRYPLLPPVVEAGRPWFGVPGQVLHVLQ